MKRDGNKCEILSLGCKIISVLIKEGEKLVITGMVSDDTKVLRSFNKRAEKVISPVDLQKGSSEKDKGKRILIDTVMGGSRVNNKQKLKKKK